MLQIFVDFSTLVEARVNKSERDSSARERVPFRVIVAPLFRDTDDSHNAHFFSRFLPSPSRALKQLREPMIRNRRGRKRRSSAGPRRKPRKTSLPQQWRAPILKRSSEDLPSLSHLPATSGSPDRPKTYNKYLMGVIFTGVSP